MENPLSLGAQRVFKMAAFLQMTTDLYGKHRFKVPNLLQHYFDTRVKAPWSNVELKVLEPFLTVAQNIIGSGRIDMTLINVLKCKSALIFMANDFAELADSLLYSPIMKDIDDWTDTLKNHISTLDEIYSIREMSYRPMLRNHTWWCLLDDVTTLNGGPIMEFQRAIKFQIEHDIVDRTITKRCEYLAMDVEKHSGHRKLSEADIFQAETLRLMQSTIEPARLARITFAKTAKALDAANAKVQQLGFVSEPERREALKMFKEADWNRIQAEEVLMNLYGFKTIQDMVKNFEKIKAPKQGTC